MQATHQKHPTFNLEGTLPYLLAAGQLLTLRTRSTLLGLFALPPIPQPLRKQNNNKQTSDSLPYLIFPLQAGDHVGTLKALSQQLICHAYLPQPSLNLAVGQLSTLQMCCTLLGLLALPPIPQPLCKQNNNKQNLGLLALPPSS